MKFKKYITIALFTVLCLSALASGFFIYRHASYRQRIEAEAKANAIAATKIASREIDAILSSIQKTAETIAEELTAAKLEPQQMASRLRTELAANQNLFGIAIAYRPYQFNKNRRLYAPYATNRDGKISIVQVEDLYDYTVPGVHTVFYTLPLETGTSQWIEPFWGTASNRLIYSYSAVFYADPDNRTREKISGVVVFTVALNKIKTIIESLDLGAGGYGGMISKKGVYLYHPVSEYARNQKSVFDLAKEKNDPSRQLLGAAAAKGSSGVIDHTSTTTGLEAWLIYESIPASGAALNNTFLKDDIHFDVDELRRQVILIIVSLVIALVSGTLLAMGAVNAEPRRLALASLLVTVITIASIAAVWWSTIEYSPNRKKQGIRIIDHGSLHQFIADCRARNPESQFIPTGVMITSAELISENEAEICGFLWQKYSAGIHDRLIRGVEFPDAKTLEIADSYRETIDGSEVIGWKFKADLIQKFDYAKFPLDQERIMIGIRHRDFINHVLLVPDLDSYKLVNPSALPGLAPTLALPGWQVEKSYYEYFPRVFNTTLGIPADFFRDNSNELYFKIVARRLILNVFIARGIPIIVVSILLFIFLMTLSTDPVVAPAMRSGVGRIMSATSGLFFVVIYSHIDLRGKLGGDAICYLEYVYFIIYFIFLAVSLVALLFAAYPDLKVVRYRDCLIPKLLYWPLYTLLIFIITVRFYY